MFYESISFDWYEATIHFGTISSCDIQVYDDHAYGVITTIQAELNGDIHSTIARNGFRSAVNIVLGDETLCNISWGNGGTVASCVHVKFTGSHSSRGSDILKKYWPEHSVTRCDVAYDTFFEVPVQNESFLQMVDWVSSNVIEKTGLKSECAGDWLKGVAGRTLYIGGRQSPVRCRIYEKGLHPDEIAANAPETWVRFEMQFRPHRTRRADVALCSPIEVIKGCEWFHRIINRYYAAIPRTKMDSLAQTYNPKSKQSVDYGVQWLCRQYGKTIKRLLTDKSYAESFDVILDQLYASSDYASDSSKENSKISIPDHFYDDSEQKINEEIVCNYEHIGSYLASTTQQEDIYESNFSRLLSH